MDYTPWMNELGTRLRMVDNHITFEFAAVKSNGLFELILTANGYVPTFPIVFLMVDSKPKLKNFEVCALRQAGEGEALRGLRIETPGVKIDINDTYFEYEKDAATNKLNFIFYIKGYNGNYENYGNMLLILLDRVIGEYNVATKVGEVHIRRLRYANVEKYISAIKMNEIIQKEFKEQ